MINKLTRRNFLKRAGLVGVVGIGFNGCGKDDKYHFNGEIDGEKIRFFEEKLGSNYLEVIKLDGRKITYGDTDFSPDYINYLIITKDGETKEYFSYDEIGKPIIKEAQEQYEGYLKKILEEKERIKQEKIQEGLDLIRK